MTAGARGQARRGQPRIVSRDQIVPGSGPLARVPAVAAFAAVVAVFVAGVVIGGLVGTLLLAALAVGVVVLLGATWSRLTPAERAGRMLVLAVLVAVAVAVAVSAGATP